MPRHIKFNRRYEVSNGTGNSPGPVFEKDGVYLLPDDQADFWLRTGHAGEATADEVANFKPPELKLSEGGIADGLDDMKAKDLIALAEKEKIELGDATKKADIVARIREHRANPPAEGEGGDGEGDQGK